MPLPEQQKPERRHPAELVKMCNPAIEQLNEKGLLIKGNHQNPAAMAPRIQSLLETAVANV